MKVKLLEDYNFELNDYDYEKDEILEISEIEIFKGFLNAYYNVTKNIEVNDWIRTDLIQIIEI